MDKMDLVYYFLKSLPLFSKTANEKKNPDAGRIRPSIFNYFSFLLLLTCPCSIQEYQEAIYSCDNSGPVFQAQENLLVWNSVIR